MIIAMRLGLAAAALLAAIAGGAAAETRTVRGDRLELTHTLSSNVVIDTDATLAGNVRVSADGSLSCLSVTQGTVAVIGTAGCDDDLEGLRITVSPDMPVVLSGTGDGGARIGDLHGPLTVTMADSYDIKAGHVRALSVAAHGSGNLVVGGVDGEARLETVGSGDVRVGRLRGSLLLQHHGSGDLAVGAIEATGVTVDSAGSGDVLIGGGSIFNLQAHLAGSGDLAIAARVTYGDVSAAGGGDVKLSTVTGKLTRSAAGGSDISVGGPAVVTDVMARVARAAANAPDESSPRRTSGQSHWVVHVIMAGLAATVLFFIWRIIRRSARAPVGQGAALHPGVTAVCETMTRLDQRLGRLEGYVTTREFELNRKFRELGPR